MKKKFQILTSLSACLPVFMMVIMYSKSANAQYVWAAANADPTYYTTLQPTWMNNACFGDPNSTAKNLYGVVWDDGAGGLTFSLQDNVPNTYTQLVVGPAAITNKTMSHPDIVLGFDGTNYYMGVVYTVLNNTTGASDIYLETYRVNNVGVGPLTVTSCAGGIKQVGNSGLAGSAHMDIAFVKSGSIIVANKIAIAWEDKLTACKFGTDFGARACSGSLADIANCNTVGNANALTFLATCINDPATGGSRGQQVDIAIHYNPTSSAYLADICYDDLTQGKLFHAGYNVSTNSGLFRAMVDNPGANHVDYPRIDAVESKPLGAPNPQTLWDIAYKWKGDGPWQVADINSMAMDIVTQYYVPNTANADMSKPAISQSTGKGFSIVYADVQYDKIYLNNEIWANGGLSKDNIPATDYDYYEVSYNQGIADPVAISSSYKPSTWDMDVYEEFVCWYNTDNGEIDCKITSAYNPVFKPTNVKVMKEADKLQVYPNPANNEIVLKAGAIIPTTYSITDMLGKTVVSGNVTGEIQRVVLKDLAKGMYLLKASYAGGYSESFKIMRD